MIWIKLTEDDVCENSYYARIGGVSTKEMTRVEMEFMKLIDFNIYISKEEFRQYENDFQDSSAQ